MRTFDWSDLHFGHANILSFTERPYDTLDEMNEGMVTNWNAVVDPGDEVYVIGDIVMGQRAESLKYVERLNGTKYLIPGNHDYVHPMYADGKRFERHVGMYEDAGLIILPPEIVMTFEGITFRMCHFPYDGDSREDAEDRYPEWRPVDDGLILLHGHTHSTEVYRGHQCHVGVDAHDHPQLLTDILGGFQP